MQREGRIEVDVWGWGRNLRSWLVDHIVVEGEIANLATWDQVTTILSQTWPHAGGQRMGLARLAIDTGDGVTTDEVYSCERRAGGR